MAEKFLNWPSFFQIFFQTLFNKVTQMSWIFLSIESMWLSGGYHVHRLEWWQFEIWRFSFNKLDKNDSNRPYINELVIKILINKLGSHPCRSANNSFSLLLFFGKLYSKSKISNFNISIFIDKNIITFKIPMDLFFIMNKIQSL